MSVDAQLRACELPQRWRDRPSFVLLAWGGEADAMADAAVALWRNDPRRPDRLHVVLARDAEGRDAPDDERDGWLASETDDGRVHRLRIRAGAARKLVARADALLVGATAIADLRDARSFARTCARLCAPGARLVVETLGDPAIGALQAAGFERLHPNDIAEADAPRIWSLHARVPQRTPPAWQRADGAQRHAIVVGAGLAGCATAWALALHGWRATLLDAGPKPGGTAAVQPAGVFHTGLRLDGTLHARFWRIGAREAHAAATVAIARHGVLGDASGLLQLIDDSEDSDASRPPVRGCATSAPRHRRLDASNASMLAGTRLARSACWHRHGGWIEPGGLARSFIERAAPGVVARFGIEIASLDRAGDAWVLRDRDGEVVAQGAVVVLANGIDAARLAGAAWPLLAVRGQSSVVSGAVAAGCAPRLPIAGGGFVTPTGDGGFAFGATAQRGDMASQPRPSDHRDNLARLATMAPDLACGLDADALEGRVGWRCVSRDRLPLIGAVPDPGACGQGRRDVARLVPRRTGLYVHAALGSRGISVCALGARVIAALVSGAPVPLASDLIEAVDPARFEVRALRRSTLRPADPP
jgi:tRNA 5-methylaminomethyl-2-thiouridine biosynthesis bifunctional protein